MQNNWTDEQWAGEFERQLLKALSDDEAGHLFHLAVGWVAAGAATLPGLDAAKQLMHAAVDIGCDVQRENLKKHRTEP